MGINLKKELSSIRAKYPASNQEELLNAFKLLLDQPSAGEKILQQLTNSVGEQPVGFQFDLLETDRIYHIDHIEKLCVDYRLRFLDSSLFSGTYPAEALEAIRQVEETHNVHIEHYKIVAPAPMFKLVEKDKDPLLFAPMGNGYYYLLAQWGNDLHPLRKLAVYPFRTFETMLKTVVVFSALIALAIPADVMRGPKDDSVLHIRVIFFFYMLIASGALTTLYGFSRMKNFNANLWKSKFFD